MTLLRFDGVSKKYPGGHLALHDLSFSVQAGEMLVEALIAVLNGKAPSTTPVPVKLLTRGTA